MSKFLFLSLFILFSAATQHALGQSFNAEEIKPELKANAHAVFRLYENNYTVKDTDKAELTCRYIITILNKNGDGFAEFEEYYDKFTQIEDLEGKVYNNKGEVIKKFKSSDFTDLSAVSNSSIYDDNRMKYLKPLVASYPYTVEYKFKVIYNGFTNIPSWNPQPYYDLSIEKAIFTLTVPKGYNLRYLPINNAQQPAKRETATGKEYHLQAENMPALEWETLSPGLQDFQPIGYFIPEYFKIDGRSCNNDSWKNLGLFFSNLNQQKNQLSEKTIDDLDALKKKASSKRELVKLIYEYMQSKTRYVSIQLGIGGLQPFDASIVDKNGYGDCKALTNYTQALLKQVEIPSIYTIVKAGDSASDILTEVSFNQFNHVILAVPLEKDTVWLECTNQKKPFGFLGSFTDNRNVLMITEKGGVLVKTPYYDQKQNKQMQTARVQLYPDGKAETIINTKYTGLQYDDNISILYQSPEEQKKDLYTRINLPTFAINNYKLSEEKHEILQLNSEINLTATRYAIPMGNRLLLPLNMLNKRKAIAEDKKERKMKMQIRYAYVDFDSIIFNLPEGYNVESFPKSTEIKSDFGSYSSNIEYSADKKSIIYVREINVKDGLYPKEKYKDYVAFIKAVSLQDNIKVSLIKQ